VPAKLNAFSHLGPALRMLREKAGLTQVTVAERTGIAQNRLSRYENGKQVPDLPTLDRLLSCYEVDVERLGQVLKDVQGIETPSRTEADPEFTARVREALMQLGYPEPQVRRRTAS
jgi:transcriptional regulator with XRE-family HTH domain